MLYLFLNLISLLALLGCSRTPAIPPFPAPPQQPIEQILLGNSLSVKEVRKIFQALNQDGKLNSLRPWFENVPDAQLSELGEITTKHLYEETFDKKGLVSLIESRIQRRGFQRWNQAISQWATERSFHSQWAFLKKFLTDAAFPTLIEGDKNLLHPALPQILERIQEKSQKGYQPLAVFPSTEPVTDEALAKDLFRFFAEEPLREKLSNLITELSNHHFPRNLLRALSDQRQKYGDARPFEGFVFGHTALLPEERLFSLFFLLDTLNAGSNGLFKVASEQFSANPGIGQEIAKRFSPLIAKGAVHSVLQALSSPEALSLQNKQFWLNLPRKPELMHPSEEFIQLFKTVQWGMEQLRSETKGPVYSKFPITLASLLTTEWLEHFARANAPLFSDLGPETFVKSFWQSKTSVPKFRLSLANDGAPTELSTRLQNDLEAIIASFKPTEQDAKQRLVAFRESLQLSLKDQSKPPAVYSLPETKDLALNSALGSFMEKVQQESPLSDPGPFFLSLLHTLVGEGGDSPLEGLERENLLDSLFNLLQGLKYTEWKGLKSLLFESLALGNLSDADKGMLLSLYSETPELLEKLNTILDNLQTLYAYDTAHSLPSSFELCHSLLRKTAPDDIHGVSALVSFPFQAHLFHLKKDHTPEFPAIHQLLRYGRSLSQTLFQFSFLTPSEQNTFLKAFETVQIHEHLTFLGKTAKESPASFIASLKTVSHHGLSLLPSLEALTEKERNWLMLFLGGEHETLWSFLQAHSSRENLLQLVRELALLSKNGALKDTFEHLSHLQNERIQRLASVLKEWQNSGELNEFLASLETLLRD